MELIEALTSKKNAILALWIERTLDSYSSSAFFKNSKDPFANPVGSNISEGLGAIFDLLLAAAEPQAYSRALDQVVRIRAVQEFSPSQALAPFLELKWVIRQILSTDRACQPLLCSAGLDIFDCAVDRVALAAFDVYTQCREQLYQNRIRELKSGSYVLTDAACPSALLRRDKGLPPAGQTNVPEV